MALEVTTAPVRMLKALVDTKTGLPIVSLYGKSRKPSAAMMEGIDVVVFDIQDVGGTVLHLHFEHALPDGGMPRKQLRNDGIGPPEPQWSLR